MTQAPYSLLIDQVIGETRCAVLQNDRLVELHIDRSDFSHDMGAQEGNIYLGRVINVVPTLQAAFVDIGCGINGFLPLSATFEDDISKAVHEGQAVLVQVRKVAHADKGPQLTCKLDLMGKNVVLTPNRAGTNVSRKFKDPEKRHTFREFLQKLVPDGVGLVVRTSAEDLAFEELARDVTYLLGLWQKIEVASQIKTAPALLHMEKPFLLTIWDRYVNVEMENVIIEGIDAFQIMKNICPIAQSYKGATPLFESLGIEDQIEVALNTYVALPQGGNVVIERTTALIAIDVNMGERLEGRNSDDNHLRLNMAAIGPLKEQIVLRNLSGQILIDFINLRKQGQQAQLLDAIRAHFKDDPRTTVHGFSKMGLCELSRARVGYGLDELLLMPQNRVGTAPSRFFAMIRALQKGGMPTVRVGKNLHNLCEDESVKPTLDWLQARMGYRIEFQKDLNLADTAFVIEKVT
jgi:Rne/Rng family ribonuclease